MIFWAVHYSCVSRAHTRIIKNSIMANLEIKILPTRKKATGKLKIYIFLTFKRQIRYIGTEFEIDDEAEIDNGRICYRKDAAIMNKRLSFILNEYKERLRRIDVRKFDSCSQLKDYLIRTEIVESLTIIRSVLLFRVMKRGGN